MNRLFFYSASLIGLTLMSSIAIAQLPDAPHPIGDRAPTGSPAKNWTADNGNGTYSNPLFYEEFEDPDIIRVGEDYYLAGTTMHMNPAVQIMHSKDLVNWQLLGYCEDKLDLGPKYRLDGGNIYGQGIWAPCIRFHNGMFYILCNVNGAGLMVYRSKSINGPWERNQLPGRHDMSILFDDDLNKVFIIHGNHSPYTIEELSPDLKSIVPNVKYELALPKGMPQGEGHHLYKINGKYVDIMAIPGGTVNQIVAIADKIEGPWKSTTMVEGESLGVTVGTPSKAAPNNPGLWIHQGGMVETPAGEWWSVIMSDHGSAGRMVSLVPITWDDGFPLIGLPGNLRKAPNTWIKPNTGFKQDPKPAFVHNDSFDGPKLNPHSQWNHVPDDSKWSLTEKPGVLRLHSLPAKDLFSARNSLCQRPAAPESITTVELDTSGMTDGDVAGLGLISVPFAWIGVVKNETGATVQMIDATGSMSDRRGMGATPPSTQPTNLPAVSSTTPPSHLQLRMNCNFDTDEVTFSWSADGQVFTSLGKKFIPRFQLQTFQGVRTALFHFNTSGKSGGYADFDNFTVDQPRARGIEREIPIGKTIVLTSGADGSYLVADLSKNELINQSADSIPENARFQVIDLGLGRVALKAANGKIVSVESPDKVTLKEAQKPGDAESFQWINLMRGDTMLMTLTNHQYLTTKPQSPGAVTANARGPGAARKSGAEFKWKVVE